MHARLVGCLDVDMLDLHAECSHNLVAVNCEEPRLRLLLMALENSIELVELLKLR